MGFILCVLFSGAFLLASNDAAPVYPHRQGLSLPYRLRSLQQRSAMYYQPNMMYIPAMATFTAGDISTDYLNPPSEVRPCPACNNIPQEPEFEENTQVYQFDEQKPPEEESSVSTATKVPDVPEIITERKIVPKKPPQEEEEEDEDEYEDWPNLKNHGRKHPPNNVFFPMMFGYPGGSGKAGGNTGYPGGATAIANSFSSGKGGIATSHATAYGNAPGYNKHSTWKRRPQNED